MGGNQCFASKPPLLSPLYTMQQALHQLYDSKSHIKQKCNEIEICTHKKQTKSLIEKAKRLLRSRKGGKDGVKYKVSPLSQNGPSSLPPAPKQCPALHKLINRGLSAEERAAHHLSSSAPLTISVQRDSNHHLKLNCTESVQLQTQH